MAVRKIREGVSLPSWKRASEVQINKGACKPIKVDEPDKEKEHAIDVQTLKAYFKQKEKKMQQSKDAKKMKLSENSVAEGFTYTDKVAEGFDYINEEADKFTYRYKSILRVLSDADFSGGGYRGGVFDLYYDAKIDEYEIVQDIKDFVENYDPDDLITYIDDNLKGIVNSIKVKVEVEGRDLVLYTFVGFNERPEARTLMEVKRYLVGQFGDGWGENLEQQKCAQFDYTTDDGFGETGDVYVTVDRYAVDLDGQVFESKAVEKKAVKEDTPTVDNTAPADKNKESTYKIYGWTLEVTYPDNRLYSGPRYWLYNPSGYGGSLQFYYAPEEIAQARADGKQVVGFEGNTLPKTLLDTLIKKYIRGDFDNRQLALENKQETATKLLKECECDYFDSISDTEYRLATLRELGYADIADRFEELLCKEKEKRETINSLLDLLLNPQPSEPVADPIAEPTPDTDDLNMVVEPTDEIPDEVPNDENKEEVEDDNKDSRE